MAIRVSGVGSGGRRPPPVREEPPVDILAAARDKAAMELPPAPLASGELVHSSPLLWFVAHQDQ
uniref:Uncharacterized protein n=1 Tax=Aegilops tauschii TaxID=37682 RepID=N1R419_AEGTA